MAGHAPVSADKKLPAILGSRGYRARRSYSANQQQTD
jgi:hypothetical protein